jgi:Tat protein translocase TatB subunit
MFGLGIWEIVVILAVALIVLGPRRLPHMARQLGRALREFRRATNELRYSIDEATGEHRGPPAPTAPSPYTEPTEVNTSKPQVPINESPVVEELAEQASAGPEEKPTGAAKSPETSSSRGDE